MGCLTLFGPLGTVTQRSQMYGPRLRDALSNLLSCNVRTLLIPWLLTYHAALDFIFILSTISKLPPGDMEYKIAKPKLFAEPSYNLDKFFDKLPFEIRNRVYFWILRPDCLRNCRKKHVHHHRSDRCLDFLTAAARFYVEAIEILHLVEYQFEITKNAMPLFRSGKDFGKPLQFECLKPTSRCYLPPKFSELEFVKLRKIILIINFEPFGTTELDRNLKTLSQAVRKMTNVQRIHIRLRYCFAHQEHDNEFRALNLLLGTINEQKIHMILGPHLIFGDDNILQKWIKTVAQTFPRNIEIIPWPIELSDCQSTIDSESEATYWMSLDDNLSTTIIKENNEDNTTCTTVQTQDAREEMDRSHAQPHQSQISSEVCAMYEVPSGILRTDYVTCGALKDRYQLVPECRSCLTVFGTWEALKAHLVRSPRHQRRFSDRPQNFVRERDRKPANRKCWTCGAGFVNLELLDNHLYTHRHHRYGIVPRYVEDNERYDHKWRLWKEERGWL